MEVRSSGVGVDLGLIGVVRLAIGAGGVVGLWSRSARCNRRWSRSLLDRRWCGSSDFGVDRRGAIGVGVDLCLIGAGVARCDEIGAISAMLRSARPVECGLSDWSSVYGRRNKARSEE